MADAPMRTTSENATVLAADLIREAEGCSPVIGQARVGSWWIHAGKPPRVLPDLVARREREIKLIEGVKS